MRIRLTSVSVGDQEHALKFYTEILGFQKKQDIPMGDASWLTVVSPDDPDGTELLLEPNAEYPAMKAFKESLIKDGIPFTAFEVDDLASETERLKDLGVHFATSMKTFEMSSTSPTLLKLSKARAQATNIHSCV